jgi:hypothetical protein
VFTLGQRKSLSDQLRIFAENQFSRSEERSGLATVFGLDFRPSQRWTLGLSVERSRLEEAHAGDVDRDAISLSALAEEDPRQQAQYRRDRAPPGDPVAHRQSGGSSVSEAFSSPGS